MPIKPAKKPKKVHRDMPEDPRQLAKAMFNMADRKIEKDGRATQKKPVAQRR